MKIFFFYFNGLLSQERPIKRMNVNRKGTQHFGMFEEMIPLRWFKKSRIHHASQLFLSKFGAF